MAVTAFVYGDLARALFNKEIDFDTDDIKVALVASGYTPNQDAHNFFDDVSAFQVTGTGYTAGGISLEGKSLSYDAASNTLKLLAANVVWANSTITARYAVVYDNTPATTATKNLLLCIDFGADVSSSSGDFAINWDPSGVLNVVI